MAKFIHLQAGEVKPYEITKGEMIIGRLPECDIKLDSNMLSRKHARIVSKDGQYFIEDLGSGNGTFVNGKKITGLTPIDNETRIKLGPLLFRFESDSLVATKELESFAQTGSFNVDISTDETGSPTIMGAIDNASGYGSLEVNPEAKLKAVLEISRALAGNVDVNVMLPKILDTLFTIFPHADRGCILANDDKTQKMIPKAMKHRRNDQDDTVKLSRTILKTVLEQRSGILSADASSDSRFTGSESISNLTIRSMMCVPMLGINGEPVGVINIDTSNTLKQFRKDDLEILSAVAGQAALSYETARLIQSYTEKQKQDSEMKIAQDVQKALLPESLPELKDYQFFASYDSAQAVGGDYYDVFPLSNNRICIAFGDVAGKGVPASLVMSRLSSVVRSAMETMTDLNQAVTLINNHMCNRAVEGRFVTMVIGYIDLTNHKYTLVNAGHMSPIFLKQDGTMSELDDALTGIPIGVMEDFPYDIITYDLAPQELFVIYTDGVSEAMNPKSDLYTTDRLKGLIKKKYKTFEELGVAIREDVRTFANGRAQNDDITMMVVGRK